MMQRIEMAEEQPLQNTNPTVIKVVGVGGGGVNAVNRMIDMGISDVEMIAINTDRQALSIAKADTKIVIGEKITGGLGAGMDPVKGEQSAEADVERIEQALRGANLVFVTSGFGGGTGTGASPVIARIAKSVGALTIGIVTKPFEMEGTLRMKVAEDGIRRMLDNVDSLILIPNENLFKILGDRTSYQDAIRASDDVLRQGVQGIADIITVPSVFVNIDFADVKSMIEISRGRAHMGIGHSKGEGRVRTAMEAALRNPLLEVENIKGAKGILANIVCSKDFTIAEYREAARVLHSFADADAHIKIGVSNDETMKDEIKVTVIATGFEAGAVSAVEDEEEIILPVRQERVSAAAVQKPKERELLNDTDEDPVVREEVKAPAAIVEKKSSVVMPVTAEKKPFRLPYEVVSEEELDRHKRLGNLEDMESPTDADIDTPAFMRRQSILKRS